MEAGREDEPIINVVQPSLVHHISGQILLQPKTVTTNYQAESRSM